MELTETPTTVALNHVFLVLLRSSIRQPLASKIVPENKEILKITFSYPLNGRPAYQQGLAILIDQNCEQAKLQKNKEKVFAHKSFEK